MTESFIVGVAKDALLSVITISGPILAISLGVGLLISIFQATTQIQEQTLTFVPKIIAVFISIIILGPWMLQTLVSFTQRMFDAIPLMVR
ncbi:flagellar biosynthetic protein FliQ [Oxobacter pfennigii]|uniref:Flagellar biosynthetic protein FliQ n=1 Tax=Oxobacter pfennigii TaxID=36849 RepID=A0A0P8W9P7_9CLOT|nr:flagellar biosynthesis protein FliQ [Oxobacter pfennigii]KPU44702.1 flagellar biosynthetic protein FliQ [Oxobacter pfennigii]